MRRQFIFIILSLVTITTYSQYNLDMINSVNDEQCPVISPDGKTMFFTRANSIDNVGGVADKGDIWSSTLVKDQWSTPIQAGAIINNEQWNAVMGFSNNGNTMILHHHYNDGKQGLSVSQKRNDHWSQPTTLKIPYFVNRSKLQSGSISNDGNIMLLSIESYNTKGGEDIYVVLKDAGGEWTDPKNLGNVVNTKFQELTPYLAGDNKTLFFASNGHPNSAGSFDIYRTVRQGDSWTNWSVPENLGATINTEGRESSYQILAQGKEAIYVSTLDSDGYGDIRSVKQQEQILDIIAAPADTVVVAADVAVVAPLIVEDSVASPVSSTGFYFTGTIADANDGSLLNGNILLTALPGGLQTAHKVDNGNFDIPLPLGDYHLGVEAKGYLSKFLTVNVDSVVTRHQITLSPIIVGETVNLSSVLFRRATADLLPASYDELDAVVNMMQENPGMEILLGGHTDNQGSSKLNYTLSEKRVESVKKYLQDQGISGRRIEGKGYGGSRPIASNKNEATRKLNRRVAFTVTKE
jgi:outer membrane protein OmpA-like peptidoglycan-associated protein